MGLNIRLHDINLKNNFRLSFRTGSTAGDLSIITTGYTSFINGATLSGNTVYASSDVIDYNTTPIIFPNSEFNTQYWFKFLDTITGLYTIKNINTHESKYYECYDMIDFYVTVTEDICDTPIGGDTFNPRITLYDYPNNNGYGNNSSNGSTYNIYTGTTPDINSVTTGFITGVTTNQSTGVIYSFTYTVDYPPTLPMEPLYVFVEHSDGSVWNGNNTNPRRQGGFEVKRVRLVNEFDYLSPNETQPPFTLVPTQTPLPTPIPTSTPSPTPLPATATPTNVPTNVPTATPTNVPTATPTNTTAPAGATYTPTPTNTTAPAGATYTPTPTSTFLPFDMVVYSGGTLGGACSNVNGPYTVYYRGSLGIGTDLFTDSNCTVAVNTPGYYWSDNATVYLVGLPSVEDGRITDIVACATPTPTPIPVGYFTGYVSDGTAQEACDGGIYGPIGQVPGYAFAFDIIGNATGDLCNATQISTLSYGSNTPSGDIIKPMDQGGIYDMNPDFYVSDGTYVRQFRRQGTGSSALPLDTCVSCTEGPTPTPTPLPPTVTPTPTPLPDGVLDFASSDSNFQQCGEPYGSNDYEYDRTYYVEFTSARSMGGYVVVYLNGGSNIQLPFNQNDTLASLIVSCGCGSSCESIEYVMSIIYSTPTPTPEPLLPTSTPTEGDGGELPQPT